MATEAKDGPYSCTERMSLENRYQLWLTHILTRLSCLDLLGFTVCYHDFVFMCHLKNWSVTALSHGGTNWTGCWKKRPHPYLAKCDSVQKQHLAYAWFPKIGCDKLPGTRPSTAVQSLSGNACDPPLQSAALSHRFKLEEKTHLWFPEYFFKLCVYWTNCKGVCHGWRGLALEE